MWCLAKPLRAVWNVLCVTSSHESRPHPLPRTAPPSEVHGLQDIAGDGSAVTLGDSAILFKGVSTLKFLSVS